MGLRAQNWSLLVKTFGDIIWPMHSQRKLDHLRICLEEDVAFKDVRTGLEKFRLTHQALPELALDDIDLSRHFLAHRLNAPLLISAMTGGTPSAEEVNRNLAAAAQAMGIAMSVGSQRAALMDENLVATYSVRDIAPDILLFANLGAVQLNYEVGVDECRRAVDMIQADALVLHLNPLQECLQPHGNTDFRGLLDKIEKVCTALSVPVIVKEVGWGLSSRVAQRLIEAGVSALDVAGAGGTCWAAVERLRAEDESLRRVAEAFLGWGIPTADSILSIRKFSPSTPLIASGGIRTGIDVVKSMCLGADIAGIGVPLLRLAAISAEEVIGRLHEISLEMRIAMLCLGAQRLDELNTTYLCATEPGAGL